MKTTIITAMLLAIAIAAGYFYFAKKTTDSVPFEITGTWKIDTTSQQAEMDTIKEFLPLAKASYQEIEFLRDSICWIKNENDSLAKKYYLRDSTLMIYADSLFQPHLLKIISPEQIQIFIKDSSSLLLRRQ